MSRSLTTNISDERAREFYAYDLVALSNEGAIPANDSFLSLDVISSNSPTTTIGFLSRDPIGFVDGYNLYANVFGIDQMDPYGNQIIPNPTVPGQRPVVTPRSSCDSAAAAISILFLGDPNGLLFWAHFTGGSGREVKLTNDQCLGVMGSNPKALSALADAKNTCSGMSGVSGSKSTSETLNAPWTTSLGGVTSSFEYSCECYCWRWNYTVSDNYDWKSILREWKTHRSIRGQIVTLGFDLAQTITRCTANGHWKEFPISGSCSGGTCR